MKKFTCDLKAIMEELVQCGTIWGYEIGMAEILSHTIKYLSLRVKKRCEVFLPTCICSFSLS